MSFERVLTGHHWGEAKELGRCLVAKEHIHTTWVQQKVNTSFKFLKQYPQNLWNLMISNPQNRNCKAAHPGSACTQTWVQSAKAGSHREHRCSCKRIYAHTHKHTEDFWDLHFSLMWQFSPKQQMGSLYFTADFINQAQCGHTWRNFPQTHPWKQEWSCQKRHQSADCLLLRGWSWDSAGLWRGGWNSGRETSANIIFDLQ